MKDINLLSASAQASVMSAKKSSEQASGFELIFKSAICQQAATPAVNGVVNGVVTSSKISAMSAAKPAAAKQNSLYEANRQIIDEFYKNISDFESGWIFMVNDLALRKNCEFPKGKCTLEKFYKSIDQDYLAAHIYVQAQSAIANEAKNRGRDTVVDNAIKIAHKIVNDFKITDKQKINKAANDYLQYVLEFTRAGRGPEADLMFATEPGVMRLCEQFGIDINSFISKDAKTANLLNLDITNYKLFDELLKIDNKN